MDKNEKTPMRYLDAAVSFEEVPDEINLCIEITNCPVRCPGCHSRKLWKDIGTVLDEDTLDRLLEKADGVTCVCFMGGDRDMNYVCRMAQYIHDRHHLRTAWYSGHEYGQDVMSRLAGTFDWLKTGPYIIEKGPINDPRTNQRLYRRNDGGNWDDVTYLMREEHGIG